MQIIFSDKTIESANSENFEKMQNLLFYIIKFGAVCNTEIGSWHNLIAAIASTAGFNFKHFIH